MAGEARRPDTPFWVEPDAVGPDSLRLTPEESHHLLHVFRARPGTPFEAVDGAGRLYECELSGTERRAAIGRILARRERAGELPGRLVLLAGMPGAAAAQDLVARAVPLGVSAIHLVAAERGECPRGTEARAERLGRIARAALKQSRRTVLPELRLGAGVAEILQGLGGGGTFVLADPAGASWSVSTAAGVKESVVVAVGPPGGFSESEKALFAGRGFVSISLGNSRLRTEDAASALLALAREGILSTRAASH